MKVPVPRLRTVLSGVVLAGAVAQMGDVAQTCGAYRFSFVLVACRRSRIVQRRPPRMRDGIFSDRTLHPDVALCSPSDLSPRGLHGGWACHTRASFAPGAVWRGIRACAVVWCRPWVRARLRSSGGSRCPICPLRTRSAAEPGSLIACAWRIFAPSDCTQPPVPCPPCMSELQGSSLLHRSMEATLASKQDQQPGSA